MSMQENISNMDVDGGCSMPMTQPSTGTETCADSKSKTMKRKTMKPRSEEWQESDDCDVSTMGVRMKRKFDKYWGDPDKTNKLFYIAVVLDPRHKLDFVEFMLVELHGAENGARVGKMVKEILLALYKDYKEKMEPNTSKMLSIQESSDIEPKNLSQTDLKRQSILAKYKRQKEQIFGDGSISELDKYLNEMVEEYCDSFDILGWWKQNCHRFPILAQIARDVLAIPISTVASESAFSTGGRVLDCFRSSLTPMVVESLICTQDWLRSSPIPINVEETLDDIEKLERDVLKLCWTLLRPHKGMNELHLYQWFSRKRSWIGSC